MLCGPIDFDESKLKIVSLTSKGVTGDRTIESRFLFARYSFDDLVL